MKKPAGDVAPADHRQGALQYAAKHLRRVLRFAFLFVVVGVVFLPLLPIVPAIALLVILLLMLYGMEIKAAARLVRDHGLTRVTVEDLRRRRSIRDRGWIVLFDHGPPLDAREAPKEGADLYLAGDPEKGRVALAQFPAGERRAVALNLLWPSRRATTG
jgi:hypothetical protein